MLRCADGEIDPWPLSSRPRWTSATVAMARACVTGPAWSRACAWASLTRAQTWALVDSRSRYVRARDLARAARRIRAAGLGELATLASEHELARASVMLARGSPRREVVALLLGAERSGEQKSSG